MTKTTAIIFPFDNFGNAWHRGGGAPPRRLPQRTPRRQRAGRPDRWRPNAYAESLFLQEVAFDTLEDLADCAAKAASGWAMRSATASGGDLGWAATI